jgi:hypothetical protein
MKKFYFLIASLFIAMGAMAQSTTVVVGLNSGKDNDELLSRTVGYTYQGAYDARLWKQCLDNNVDYFSSWGFLTEGIMSGYPTISYHVAKNISEFAGSQKVETEVKAKPTQFKVEMDGVSVYDEETKTLRVMAYNFKNKLDYTEDADFNFSVDVSEYGFKNATIKTSKIDDDCNFFDEWQEDRVKYGITDDKFSWSPDDPCIDSEVTLSDKDAQEKGALPADLKCGVLSEDAVFNMLTDNKELCVAMAEFLAALKNR